MSVANSPGFRAAQLHGGDYFHGQTVSCYDENGYLVPEESTHEMVQLWSSTKLFDRELYKTFKPRILIHLSKKDNESWSDNEIGEIPCVPPNSPVVKQGNDRVPKTPTNTPTKTPHNHDFNLQLQNGLEMARLQSLQEYDRNEQMQFEELKYGNICMLTDPEADAIHIEGLLVTNPAIQKAFLNGNLDDDEEQKYSKGWPELSLVDSMKTKETTKKITKETTKSVPTWAQKRRKVEIPILQEIGGESEKAFHKHCNCMQELSDKNYKKKIIMNKRVELSEQDQEILKHLYSEDDEVVVYQEKRKKPEGTQRKRPEGMSKNSWKKKKRRMKKKTRKQEEQKTKKTQKTQKTKII